MEKADSQVEGEQKRGGEKAHTRKNEQSVTVPGEKWKV